MHIRLYHILLAVMTCFSACKKREDYSEVRKALEQILKDDQKYRTTIIDWSKQIPIDRKNTQIVTKIIDSLGWLGKDKIGKDANTALFIVIQHAHELSVMEKYLPIMTEAAKKGNAEKSQVAYLTDRIELLNNRKQIYGSQYSIRENGTTFIENLIDSSNVNTRRRSMSLEPIEDYIRKMDSINNTMNK